MADDLGNTPALLVAGDVHLDLWIWKQQRRITGDALHAFSCVVDLAVHHRVPLVLAGDVFDTIAPIPAVVAAFREQMDRCENAKVDVWFIQGNHDRRSPPWPSSVHAHPRWLHREVDPDTGRLRWEDIGGLRCIGFDYDTRERVQHRIAGLHQEWPLGTPQVLFLHQAVKQALQFADSWNADLEWVPPSIPLVVMGDIHTPWEARIREGQHAIYTGSTYPTSISLTGSHHCLMVYKDLHCERIELPVRPIQEFRLSEIEQVKLVEEWLKKCPRGHFPPVAWVKHTKDAAPGVLRLASEWDGEAFIVHEGYTSLAEMEIDESEGGHSEDEALQLEQLLRLLVSPDEEPEIFAFVMELLDRKGDSVQDIIRQRRKAAWEEPNG